MIRQNTSVQHNLSIADSFYSRVLKPGITRIHRSLQLLISSQWADDVDRWAYDVDRWRARLEKCRPNQSGRWRLRATCLAISLIKRYHRRGAPSDLDEAIELRRAVLVLCPLGHLRRVLYLHYLCISVQLRFQKQGILSDLDEVVELQRAVLALRPRGHSQRPTSLSALAVSLFDRFRQRGVSSDLDEAIELHQVALMLRPPGHPLRSRSLVGVASCLGVRFRQRGILSDLDEAIDLLRAALALGPLDHILRPSALDSLATILLLRFEQVGLLSDFDEAIKQYQAALVICLPGDDGRPIYLVNLASSLLKRFHQKGVLSDLDKATELSRAALMLCPPGNSIRPLCLSCLATSLGLRSLSQHELILSDLDEAIELDRAALVLFPPNHSSRFQSINALAQHLGSRFYQQGTLSDLNEAIELERAALVHCPPRHAMRPDALRILASRLADRFRQQGVLSDIDEAFELYFQLPQISHAVSRSDLRAAKHWAATAEEFKHHSVLVAYQTALKFLDQHVAILSSSSHQFDVVKEATSSLAMDAFSCGVRRGTLATAVELLEQARAVFWTQSARFRAPLDELSASGDTGAALAVEFKQATFRLRNVLDTSSEDQSQKIRELTIHWDDIISRIRILPDFSRFLLPPLFSDLQKAAEDGPVIILNASRYSCDALIILDAKDPVPVPLDITRTEVFELAVEFRSLTECAGSSDHRLESNKIIGILRKLWERTVGPIVQVLKKFIPRGSRIWWCPTAEFALLPLHAAGSYAKNGRNLSQLYISSYTPTLATLIRARQQVSRDTSVPHFVAIGQANPAQGQDLRFVADELAIVARRIAPVLSFASLGDNDATVQGALDALSQNQWLHLACHGVPNRKQPFESSFAMRDGPLTIKDIIQSRGENHEFAFLSACHTTVGDEASPDEAIHLAAAMQFSGFRSVIGTMWSVDDDVVAHVVAAFYENLVHGSGRLDCTRAAEALHKAVKASRKKMSLEQQIVFIHIGI
ncbi:hypothetical protein AZE42_02868 [Rhizopogon vesiculosus]|uniref:CHAT domain-containing protein n=1 Tax=Rhizopogon vesiculosus TaxID=180088 RepID=A0A1J8QH63_9AGAM|nr:hypothetical protein AZE42_02868 [Rhizopogon vesiculosus]